MNFDPPYKPLWQDERNQVNHVWFQNQVHGVLNQHYSRAALEKAGYREIIRQQWRRKMAKVKELICRLDVEMTPALLFDKWERLSHISEENKTWMRQVIHEAWLEKNQIAALQQAANDCWQKLNDAYPAFDAKVSADQITPPEVDEFARLCNDMSNAIHDFPTRVWLC